MFRSYRFNIRFIGVRLYFFFRSILQYVHLPFYLSQTKNVKAPKLFPISNKYSELTNGHISFVNIKEVPKWKPSH